MANFLKSVAVGGALFGASLAVPSSESVPALPVFTTEDRTTIEKSFQRIKDYWIAKGIGVAATELVLVEGDAVTTCPGNENGPTETTRATDSSVVSYCEPVDQVVFTAGVVNRIRRIYRGNTIAVRNTLHASVAHEVGHAVQHVTGDLRHGRDSRVAIENQAECYSGVILHDLYPEAVNQAMNSNIATIGDTSHGSGLMMANSLGQGVTTGECPYSKFEGLKIG